jgi:hypothetical protein
MVQSILAGFPDKPVPVAKTQKEQVDITGAELGVVQKRQDIAKGEATSPFDAPKAAADLRDKQLKVLLDMAQNARDELKTFEGLEEVKTYRQGMRYFTAALGVPKGAEGDQDLVTLAAKVQDPTGAVMQGDIDRYNNVQVAKDYLPQWAKNQWNNSGKFTPETRKRIVAFLRNRIDTYRLPYQDTRAALEGRTSDLNEQLTPLGVRPISVDKIVGSDPLKLYGPKIDAYDKQAEADRIRTERETGGPTADVFQGVPEGAQVAGTDVQGWRLSPEAEAEVNTYARSPNATAEQYGALLADKAVAEGYVRSSQRDDYAQRTALDNAAFFKQPTEQRAKSGGINYSGVDKAASENAGLFQSVAQAGRNIPESATQLAEGLVAIPKDAIVSALTGTRTGSVKTFTDLAAEIGQGQFDGPTVKAFADAMEERYGSMDAVQRTGIKDPLGLAGDLSMLLTAGGSAAARAPGVIGRVGEGVATAGRVIDPLSLTVGAVTEGVPAAYQAAKGRAPGFVTGLEDLPSEIAGFPSGSGGAALREAVGAGFERGAAGAPSPRSEAFTTGMREPESVGDDLVTAARDAVANLRQQASNAYTAAMSKFGQNPTPLSIDNVRQRMQKIKPRSYDTWSTRKGPRPSEHLAWEQMNDLVEDYAAKAVQDPDLLMPLNVDQFKQDVFDVGSKIGGAYDRDASRIAGNAYSAIRQELVKHDPIYAETMRDYEKAATEAKQLEASFGLAAARGKQPNIDSATRKLQAAIGRNNANVNYGQRAGQVERLNELDPEGTIVPTLAGATLSSWKPRGLNAAVTLGAGIPAAYTNPLALLAAPLFMPRVAGEVAYGLGRGAGTVKRGVDALAASPLGDTGAKLAELYQKYPELFLAEAQAGTRLEETEAERLRQKYAGGVPSAPAGISLGDYVPPVTVTEDAKAPAPTVAAPPAAPPAMAAPEGETYGEMIDMATGRKVALNKETNRFYYTDTGEDAEGVIVAKPAAMYRGGLMDLARKYR